MSSLNVLISLICSTDFGKKRIRREALMTVLNFKETLSFKIEIQKCSHAVFSLCHKGFICWNFFCAYTCLFIVDISIYSMKGWISSIKRIENYNSKKIRLGVHLHTYFKINTRKYKMFSCEHIELKHRLKLSCIMFHIIFQNENSNLALNAIIDTVCCRYDKAKYIYPFKTQIFYNLFF